MLKNLFNKATDMFDSSKDAALTKVKIEKTKNEIQDLKNQMFLNMFQNIKDKITNENDELKTIGFMINDKTYNLDVDTINLVKTILNKQNEIEKEEIKFKDLIKNSKNSFKDGITELKNEISKKEKKDETK